MLDKLRMRLFLRYYYDVRTIGKVMDYQNNSEIFQDYQQRIIAAQDVDFAVLPKVGENDSFVKVRDGFLIPKVVPYRILPEFDFDLINPLRHIYWDNLVARRCFIDDLQDMNDTICYNPNYDYRINAFRAIFDLWQIGEYFDDLDEMIKGVHYTQTIGNIGEIFYQQVDENKLFVSEEKEASRRVAVKNKEDLLNRISKIKKGLD